MISTEELARYAFLSEAHLEGPDGNPETADLNYDQLGMVTMCSTYLILYRGVLPVQGTEKAHFLQSGIDTATHTMRQYIQDVGTEVEEDEQWMSVWNLSFAIMQLYRNYIEAGKIILGPRS